MPNFTKGKLYLLDYFGIGNLENLFWASDGDSKCKGVIGRFAGNLKRWSWCSSHLLYLGVKKMAFKAENCRTPQPHI